MPLDFAIRRLEFGDGTTFDLTPGATVAFVGPNNAGKSTALKEIVHLVGRRGDSKVLRRLEHQTTAQPRDLLAWLNENAFRSDHLMSDQFHIYEARVAAREVEDNFRHILGEEADSWARRDAGALPDMLCLWLKAERRLAAAASTPAQEHAAMPPESPIQRVYLDDVALGRVNSVLRGAFDSELVVDFRGGGRINVHWGSPPTVGSGEDRISATYLRRVRALPLLEDQGDGVRSFVGVVLHVLLSPSPVLLVDEPEAFLHPPQARLLGRFLSERQRHGQQVFVATHSADVLRGLLDPPGVNVSVVRLERTAIGSRVSPLDTEAISALWSDPLLRHSDVLHGIFHRLSVACESESDCWFYSAIAEEAGLPSDAFFCHAGGKGGLHKLAGPLRRLGVDVRVVADFDVINNGETLSRIVEALGGNWDSMKSDWRCIADAVQSSLGRAPTVDAVAECINGHVARAKAGGTYLTRLVSDQIVGCAKLKSSWDDLKKFGEQAVPRGDAQAAWQRLNAAVRNVGLFIVPYGELESFDRESGDHGTGWVRQVLEKWSEVRQDEKFAAATRFVGTVLGQSSDRPRARGRSVVPSESAAVEAQPRSAFRKSLKRRSRVTKSDGNLWVEPWSLRLQGFGAGFVLFLLIILVSAALQSK